MIGTIVRPATGSAHQRPKKALSINPASSHCRKIRTKLRLFRVRVHGGATQSAPHLSLRTRKKWHHDKGNAGQKDARNAVLRGSLGPQVRRRFVGDVGGEAQETHADNLQSLPFVPFPAVLTPLNPHPPQPPPTAR